MLSRAWLTVWYIGVPANMGVVAVFALNAEFRSIRREIKNGMISPAAYLIAKGLLEIPIMLLFAVCALGPAAYGISNYEPSGFVSVCAVWAACIYACEAVSEVLSVQFDNPLLGMMNFMGFWFSGFLYGGFLIPGKDMIWPLKIFYYILPLKYGVRSMVYAEFIDADWSKCKTFADTGAPKGLCFGEDGADILDNLADYGFPSASSSDTVAGDILRCLAIAAVAKVGYFVLLTIKSTQARGGGLRSGFELEPPRSGFERRRPVCFFRGFPFSHVPVSKVFPSKRKCSATETPPPSHARSSSSSDAASAAAVYGVSSTAVSSPSSWAGSTTFASSPAWATGTASGTGSSACGSAGAASDGRARVLKVRAGRRPRRRRRRRVGRRRRRLVRLLLLALLALLLALLVAIAAAALVGEYDGREVDSAAASIALDGRRPPRVTRNAAVRAVHATSAIGARRHRRSEGRAACTRTCSRPPAREHVLETV